MANEVILENASGHIIGVFSTIQAAVNAAGNGDTILVGPGTYQEQVTVNGLQNLTIEGSGEGLTTILSPNAVDLTSNVVNTGAYLYEPQDALIGVENGASVTVKDLTVNGNNQGTAYSLYDGDLAGIEAVNSSLNVSNVHVTGVEDVQSGVLTGVNGNRAIVVSDNNGSHQTFTITDSTIDNFQKAGIFMEGAGLTVHVSDNTIVGLGTASTEVTQNLIELDAGATGSITDNHLSGIADSFLGGTDATGILLFEPGSGAVVDGNTVSGQPGAVNSIGVLVYEAAGTTTVEGNTFTNQGTGLYDYGPALVEQGNVYSHDVTNYYLYVTPPTPAGGVILATGGSDYLQGGGNDVFVVNGGAPTDSTFIGTSIDGGINKVESYNASSELAIESNQWVVTNGSATDVLIGIEEVVINNTTYLLVDHFGQNVGGFQSLAAAENAGHGQIGDVIAEDVNGHVQLIGVNPHQG